MRTSFSILNGLISPPSQRKKGEFNESGKERYVTSMLLYILFHELCYDIMLCSRAKGCESQNNGIESFNASCCLTH